MSERKVFVDIWDCEQLKFQPLVKNENIFYLYERQKVNLITLWTRGSALGFWKSNLFYESPEIVQLIFRL